MGRWPPPGQYTNPLTRCPRCEGMYCLKGHHGAVPCIEKHGPVCPDALAGITHGWERYGKRSLYTELPDLHGSALPPNPTHPTAASPLVFLRHS